MNNQSQENTPGFVASTDAPKTISNYSWEELTAYPFNAYPHSLVVITNATPMQFEFAVNRFSEFQQSGASDRSNIELILQDMGFVAVCGCLHSKTITL